MSTDICLINMPYSSITTPSLALGVLETYIKEFNHKVTSIYGNLTFAKMIGLVEYDLIDNSFNDYLIGEWTFSRAAFPEASLNDEGFFKLFTDLDEEKKQKLIEIRNQAELFIDEMVKNVLSHTPMIVGCTSTFQQNCASLALLKKIKAANPNVITMMGGANCEGIMGQTISEEFHWIDYVFSGECDDVIGEFIDKLIHKKNVDYHNLPEGFITQKHKNLITDTSATKKPPRAFISDMSVVGTPIFDSFFEGLEKLELSEYISPGLVAETSRGCWWGAKKHCTFCGLNGGTMIHRSKSPNVAIEELEHLSTTYNVNNFLIVDNILPIEYMKTVLPALAENTQYNLFYETKANLKKEHVEKLANAGIKWIQPGIEGLHDDFLKIIKKGTTAIQNVAALKWCRSYGIRVTWNLLCGAPFEKAIWYEEMSKWLPLITHLHPPFDQMAKICYHRFSPYFNNPQEYGLLLEPTKSYKYIYPLSSEKLFNIAYFFIEKIEKSENIYTFNFTFNSKVPEHEKVQSILDEWSQTWLSDNTPMLFMADQGESIIIIDSRNVATNYTHTLSGISAIIYRLTAEPIPEDRLLTKLKLTLKSKDIIFVQDEYQSCVDDLIENKLLIHLSKCYMALAFSGEKTDMLENKNSPGGSIDFSRLTKNTEVY